MNKIKTKNFLYGLISVILFFCIWQFVSSNNIIDPLFIGSPINIYHETINLFVSGEIYNYFWSSFNAFAWGFFLAVFVGVFLGLILGSFERLYLIFKPYIFALNSLPLVALLPLFIIWFGIDDFSKTAVVFVVAIIPIIVNTIDGSHSTEKNLLQMADSFNVSKYKKIISVNFYYDLPYIFSGIKIGVGRALVGLLAAEFYGFGKGIGYLISLYGSTFQVDRMFALLLVVIVFNVIIVNIINASEKSVIRWK